MSVYQFIQAFIADQAAQATTETLYRPPLIGATPADNPGFQQLKESLIPGHLLPQELLPGAQSVVAFFLPFSADLVTRHRKAAFISREWAVAYIETNALIHKLCTDLGTALEKQGVQMAWQLPTHNFDPQTLVARWSHKHVAYWCGLGTFGLHQMLITRAGCAGRLGSFVLDCPLPTTPVCEQDLCRYQAEKKGGTCIHLCPTGALTKEGLDKARCYEQLLAVDAYFTELGFCDACGKCALGPCALSAPTVKPRGKAKGEGKRAAERRADF